jgi:serine protease Do
MKPAKPQAPPPAPDRRGLRLIHGLIALVALALGLPMALIGGMSLLGGLLASTWIRAGAVLVVLLAIPLVIADRLLPADPQARRPGLVRDVLACSWAGAALAFVGLSASLTGAPLHAEAERLDAQGLSRAAWVGRWMAGPQQVTTPDVEVEAPQPEPPSAVFEPTPTLASASPELAASSESAAEAKPEPEPEPETTEASDAANAPEPQAPEPREYSPAELFASYAPTVVSIKVDHGGFRSGGTGFFIDDRGTIATNHHVIEGAGEVRVKLLDGAEIERVELLTSDAEVDLALLRVDPAAMAKPPIAVELGDSEAVQVGEPVSVIGNPLGLDHTLTNGIVSARRVYEGERYIQMSAPISPGNSGGPVFDRHGQVIGVSVAQMMGGQNLNLAVPVSQLRALIAKDYPNRRGFGTSSW